MALPPPTVDERHPLGIGDITQRMLSAEVHIQALEDRVAILELGSPVSDAPPANVDPPLNSGTGRVGDVLSVTTGVWTGYPASYAYQWAMIQAGSPQPIAGETDNTYVPTMAVNNKDVYCVVTAANAAGETDVASNAITVTAGSRSQR